MNDSPTLSDDNDSHDPSTTSKNTIDRRRFLVGTAGGIVGLGIAGVVGYEWPHASGVTSVATPTEPIAGIQHFLTRPDLRPPTVVVTRHINDAAHLTSTSPRFVFLAVRNGSPGPNQQGLMITDREGRLIWFKPIVGSDPFDFNVQSTNGEQRLTWWRGKVINGYGVGTGELGNSSYETIKTIHAGGGLQEDLHELSLTSRGTAYITAFQQKTADLSSRGGSKKGEILICHMQEVDLVTGKVLFSWSSEDHVPIAESYVGAPQDATVPYDYFHINSIAELADGNLLISARNTCAVYKINRSSGEIMWRLNGKKSDFTMGAATRFYWQHDARMATTNELTLFDDGSYPSTEKQSRALLLSIDETAKTVTLKKQYLHPAGFVAANQGNTQLLDDGRVFVGWGNQPYFTEFAADGTLLLDGELPTGIRSYRAFTKDWIGQPVDKPVVVVEQNSAGGSVVYASWNGATEIAAWHVLAGPKATSLEAVGSQEWTGFETSIAVNSSGPYFSVIAADSSGKELGRTKTVKVTS